MSKVTWGDVVSIIGILIVALLVAGAMITSCGCVSAPPGARAGWSVSLVSIQLGGTCNTIDTINNLTGTNVTQRHTLPIDADMKADTSLSIPTGVKP